MSTSEPPSATSIRIRLGTSIGLSGLTIALSLLVMAVQIFLPETGTDGATPESTLLRFFDRSSEYWAVPSLIAIVLVLGLPRRRDLHALPFVLAFVAIGLTTLCMMMPDFVAGTRPGSPA